MLSDVQVFSIILATSFILTVSLNFLLELLKKRAKAKWYNKKNLQDFEHMVQRFLLEKEFCEAEEVKEIAEKIGFEVKVRKLPLFIEAELSPDMISISSRLNPRESKFSIAHEIAHIIFNDPIEEVHARRTHTLFPRSPEEQKRDYVAAALLLPVSEMQEILEESNYDQLDFHDREDLINKIAEEKKISAQLIIRRIKEVKMLVA